MKDWWLEEFLLFVRRGDLARAALAVARVGYPGLDPQPYLERLDAMGLEVRQRFEHIGGDILAPGPGIRAAVLNDFLFRDRAFAPDREHYDDPRNSFLNEVMDRGMGIPITLGVLYIEVARRAGVHVDGITFPGHFLLSCPGDPASRGDARRLILDPFDRGAVLSETDCRRLLIERVGDAVSFDASLLAPAGPQQILVRLLVNLKRAFVGMHSYHLAREVTEFLLAIDPSAFHELRDRGLLAFQLNDFTAALRDLESYLRLLRPGRLSAAADRPESPEADENAADTGESHDEESEERDQIWEYVKLLRKRVATFN